MEDEFELQLFTFIGGSVDLIVNETMFPAVERVMAAITPTVYLGMFIYLVFIILSLSGRSGAQSATALIFTVIKVVVLVELALTITTYRDMIIGPIESFQATMGGAVSGGDDSSTLYAVLDGIVAKGVEAAGGAFQKAGEAGWRNPHIILLWFGAGLCIVLGGVLVTAAGATIILAAKFIIMVLIMLGPLFLAAALFPATSKFSVGWVAAILTQSFVIIIATVIMAFAVLLFGTMLNNVDIESGFIAPLFVIAQVTGVVLVLRHIIGQTGPLSAGLSGGLSTAVMTVGDLKDQWRQAQQSVNPESVRSDMESGHPIRDTRVGHTLRGNSPVNPAWWGYQKNLAFKHYGFRNKGKMKGR